MNGGIFVNLFIADIEATQFKVQVADRAAFPSLVDLRQKIQGASVYASDRQVFGYGYNADTLATFGFAPTELAVAEVPGLTCHLLVDGFAEALGDAGFEIEGTEMRSRAFDLTSPLSISVSGVSLLPGCEFRTTFLRNPLTGDLVFGLVVDMKFQLKLDGVPVNYHELLNKLGQKHDYGQPSQVVREIRVKTGDLTPLGGRNAEAARFRLQHITSFVSRAKEFSLPTGNKVKLYDQPTRVVLEA